MDRYVTTDGARAGDSGLAFVAGQVAGVDITTAGNAVFGLLGHSANFQVAAAGNIACQFFYVGFRYDQVTGAADAQIQIFTAYR